MYFIRIVAIVGCFLTMGWTNLAGISKRPIQVYGIWHCGSDLCGWDAIRDMEDFDRKNHWIIDRGDGSPSVNLVVLSFVNPWRLLSLTNDPQTKQGLPIGITPQIIRYFVRHKIRVMLSIGGFTYVRDWDRALATNPIQLGLNAARAARQLGVGMEIDYENDPSPNLIGLQQFITAYRSVLPYNSTGTDAAARLTIDLALDDAYLAPLAQYATAHWLSTRTPVLDYANAMVASEDESAVVSEDGWLEHIGGNGLVPPLAPSKLTGGVYLATRGAVSSECTNFRASLEKATGKFVEEVRPRGSGKTTGMLGYMFWAAECPGSRSACTTPPDTCEGGVGAGAEAYKIPVPMPALRPD